MPAGPISQKPAVFSQFLWHSSLEQGTYKRPLETYPGMDGNCQGASELWGRTAKHQIETALGIDNYPHDYSLDGGFTRLPGMPVTWAIVGPTWKWEGRLWKWRPQEVLIRKNRSYQRALQWLSLKAQGGIKNKRSSYRDFSGLRVWYIYIYCSPNTKSERGEGKKKVWILNAFLGKSFYLLL